MPFSKFLASLIGNTKAQPRYLDTATTYWSFACLRTSAEMLEQVTNDIQKSAFDAAAAHLEIARAGLGDDKAVLIASAELAQAQRHWPEAQTRWQRVIDEHPKTVLAHMNRAVSVQAQGDVKQAVELYHQLIKDFPDAVGAPISIVNLLDRLDEPLRQAYAKIADDSLINLIKIHPDYPILFITRARLAKARDDWQGAHTHLVQAYEANRNDSNTWKEIRSTLEVIESRRKRTNPIFRQ